MRVGTVAQLWRYPVKSMQGERLEHARLTPQGIPGDRGVALVDAASGHVLSGKRWEDLLLARAVARPGGPVIVLPDGRSVHAADPDAGEVLSGWLGHPVRVATDTGDERPTIDSTDGTFRGRAATFFDSAPLHLLTTASLAHLATLYPGGAWDTRRFRPNVVVQTDLEGPVERDWVGRRLRMGELVFEVEAECTRCRMTTSAQDDLPRDRAILGTVAREEDNVVGVMGRVVATGALGEGEPVELL